MKATLDRYSLLIISKYFRKHNDYINLMSTNKKCDGLVDMLHYNPIPVDNTSLKLFPNIETQHIYNTFDQIIPNLFDYVVWYPSDNKTIEYFNKKYRIRPTFKNLRVSHSFAKSDNKKEGDLLYVSQFFDNERNTQSLDFSDFIGIHDFSFYQLRLKELNLGKHITTIPSHCFHCGCPADSIDLSNVTKMEANSFVWCTELTAVTLSKHLETMDINCFNGCTSLKTISISDGSKEFGLDLSCELYKIMRNNGIKCTGNVWIRKHEDMTADVDCKTIITSELLNQEVVTFDSLQIIPSNAFSYTYGGNIKQVILSPNVMTISKQAFFAMKSLESINLENVRKIEYESFMNCKKLKQVDISNTKHIDDNAFCGCSNLTSITYSSYLNYLPSECFFNCSNLREINGIEHVNILKSNCFGRCNRLKLNTHPNHLIRVCRGTCSKFKIKAIDKDCPILHFEERCFKGNTTLESIHFDNTFQKKTIGRKAFSYCTSLRQVRLQHIKSIDDGCFRDCYSLSAIHLPSSLKAIGRYCFENCWSLRQIQIPSRTKYIGKRAFLNCKSLTRVDFENGNVKMSSDVFANCPLKEINLINGNEMKGCFSYEHYLVLSSKGIDVKKVEYTRSDRRQYGNTIPQRCCRIGDRTFEGCSTKELTIPTNIKYLGYKCFNKCHNLTKIYVSSSLQNAITIGTPTNYYSSSGKKTVDMKFIKGYRHLLLFQKQIQEDESFPIQIVLIQN